MPQPQFEGGEEAPGPCPVSLFTDMYMSLTPNFWNTRGMNKKITLMCLICALVLQEQTEKLYIQSCQDEFHPRQLQHSSHVTPQRVWRPVTPDKAL